MGEPVCLYTKKVATSKTKTTEQFSFPSRKQLI